jgi:hypothetical protein
MRDSSLSWRWLLTIPLLAGLLVLWYRLQGGSGYPLDDSWIHLAFARHMAAGDGFGINPDQLSTGSTAPLWTLLLTVGFLLRAGHNVWPWLLGIVFLSGAGLAGTLVVQRLGKLPGFGELSLSSLIAGLLITSSAGLVWSAAGAMEVPLFSALLLSAWALQIETPAAARWRCPWGVPAGLAALTRPEGLLFIAILAACSNRKQGIRNLILASLFYAPFAIFCQVVSGRLFPSTFYAKTSRSFAGLPDMGYLLSAGKLIGELAPVLSILLIGGLIFQLLSSRGAHNSDSARWRPLLPGLIFLITLPVAYAAMGRTFLFAGGAGNFGRYFYPLLPFLAVPGVWWVTNNRRTKTAPLYMQAILIAAVLLNAGVTVQRCGMYKRNVDDINTMQVAMAEQLAQRFPAGTLVAANDVGALAYFTELRVLDLVGIVSPEVQETLFPLRHADHRQRMTALFNLMLELKPPAMVVFPRWYPEIVKSLQPISVPLIEIRKPNNVTSASNQMNAIELQWDRAATE